MIVTRGRGRFSCGLKFIGKPKNRLGATTMGRFGGRRECVGSTAADGKVSNGYKGAYLRCRRLCCVPQAWRRPRRRAAKHRNRGNSSRPLRSPVREGKDDPSSAGQQGGLGR